MDFFFGDCPIRLNIVFNDHVYRQLEQMQTSMKDSQCIIPVKLGSNWSNSFINDEYVKCLIEDKQNRSGLLLTRHYGPIKNCKNIIKIPDFSHVFIKGIQPKE